MRVKGATPRMENQMTYFRPTRSPMAADEGACGDREKKEEEVHLSVLVGYVELVDQVEHIIAAHGSHIKVFGEDENEQDRQGDRDAGRG